MVLRWVFTVSLSSLLSLESEWCMSIISCICLVSGYQILTQITNPKRNHARKRRNTERKKKKKSLE